MSDVCLARDRPTSQFEYVLLIAYKPPFPLGSRLLGRPLSGAAFRQQKHTMPRVSRKKRVLQTIDTSRRALQILDIIFEGSDNDSESYADELSAIS